MTVTLYENPGFTGRSVTLDIGQHRFFTTEDFNDVAASIQIPPGSRRSSMSTPTTSAATASASTSWRTAPICPPTSWGRRSLT
jgi:hypothetical protein